MLARYLYRLNRTRHIQHIASFVAIGYTMFFVYTMLIDYLKPFVGPPIKLPEPLRGLAPADSPSAQAVPETVPIHGPVRSDHE